MCTPVASRVHPLSIIPPLPTGTRRQNEWPPQTPLRERHPCFATSPRHPVPHPDTYSDILGLLLDPVPSLLPDSSRFDHSVEGPLKREPRHQSPDLHLKGHQSGAIGDEATLADHIQVSYRQKRVDPSSLPPEKDWASNELKIMPRAVRREVRKR